MRSVAAVERPHITPGFEVPEYRLEGSANVWGDLSRSSYLIRYLTKRHLANRYRGSALGFLWSFLNPVMMMIVYTFVFRFLFRSAIPGVPYPLFFLTGIFAWNFFSIGVMNAASSVIEGAYLYNKAYFPRIALPVSAVLSGTVNYLIVIPLIIVFNLVGGVDMGSNLLLMPLALLLLLLMTLGFGFIVAVLAPGFRDVIQLLEILMQVWFFLTPVLYPMSLPEQQMKDMWGGAALTLYNCNPMVGIINLVHGTFLGLPLNWAAIAYSAVFSSLLFVAGAGLFLKRQSTFSELV